MKRRFGLCLLLLVMGVVLGAWAQDEAPPPAQAPAPAPDSSQEPTQSTGPKPEYTEVDPGKSLDFLGEAVNHSTLNLGYDGSGGLRLPISRPSEVNDCLRTHIRSRRISGFPSIGPSWR